MVVIPINFSTEHKQMLGHTKMIFEGNLDKEATSYDDIFDALRLALNFYSYKGDNDF
jgi:hypothetical protein